MYSGLCFTCRSVRMLSKVNSNLVMGYIFSHLKFSMSLHWEHWNENCSWCEMLELTYLPFHFKHRGAPWTVCVTVCGFILFEVPPSKTAAGRVFSDYLCDGASYSYHLTVREGRRYPETPTHNLSCLNVPSFGIAVGGWKCGLAANLQMMWTNTKNTLLVFFPCLTYFL